MRNLIAIPPYYARTAFADILGGLRVAAGRASLPIEFIGCRDALKYKRETGGLLDDDQYCFGQATLLQELLQEKESMKVLFLDFFNPGLDLLKYQALLKKKDVTFGCLFHGASFVPGDLYQLDWLNAYEQAWLESYETIYVPSAYAKSLFPEHAKENVRIFPWGLDHIQSERSDKKIWDVVFPHRLQADKGIEDFLEIAASLPETAFLVCSPLSADLVKKNPYFDQINQRGNIEVKCNVSDAQLMRLLAQSKKILSCARQELFGYSMMRGVLAGCCPIVPKQACYPEFFLEAFQYASKQEAVHLVRSENQQSIDQVAEQIQSFSFLPLLEDFFIK